ncbi:bifunctional D-glycero-beta-D-manno-heptose-7-phosphate kinase/D-glycero-beta-D-manno-heptose 1-phosphate adenylyltransferase HldE [Terriglobus aquaticus]|uniref:Bifunctional protein HldE n=1 Tax=Terriglobus aquaticus TaxID=940139 RepID=A0ABW9KJE5_9BACT|nr:bifunctional D-glycero-beta-D-manno-heptose-7-phosphate kinase/D-glycero-beta-D-manno-heptose 1-phosphate adenylyltransferase HldE [Terriglobus aquaticus]
MVPELARVLELLEHGFASLRVLVVGDLMLDRYVEGEVERISPEAPVPVLRQAREYSRPGGAANVAMNLAGLGLQTALCGRLGRDVAAEDLRELMSGSGIDATSVLESAVPTITKTRVVSRTQQLLRLDVETRESIPADEDAALAERAAAAVRGMHAVVLSDYAKGALSPEVCRRVIEAARREGIPVLVDPKTRDFSRYRGSTTICPNLSELSVATGVAAHHTEALLAAAHELLQQIDVAFLTVTMSERGIRVLQRGEPDFVSPAKAREVFDVSGAGDTVIATLAASLAAGLGLPTAVELANLAAGIVVGKLGTVPVSAGELVGLLTRSPVVSSNEKVLTRERARARVEDWRAAGETIVFTNGCFDLLHVGHITLLEDCRRFGSKLVVALNTDASVSALKGPSRPIVSENERAKVMAALASVDLVTLFAEQTPLELIDLLRPDVVVKGGDYTVQTVVGHELVAGYGGRVEIVPTVEGFSTTNIVRKLTGGGAA